MFSRLWLCTIFVYFRGFRICHVYIYVPQNVVPFFSKTFFSKWCVLLKLLLCAYFVFFIFGFFGFFRETSFVLLGCFYILFWVYLVNGFYPFWVFACIFGELVVGMKMKNEKRSFLTNYTLTLNRYIMLNKCYVEYYVVRITPLNNFGLANRIEIF